MDRSEKLQKEFVEKHGKVGKIVSKSKRKIGRLKWIRESLRKDGYCFIDTRGRTISDVKSGDERLDGFINELIVEYGYLLQTEIS